MARLTRKNIKVFADSASNNGVFGSLQAGNPTVSNDVETLQSLTAWNYGWNSATMTSEKLPPLEEIQGVTYVTTYQQAYLMQEGMPEWAATVTYYKGSLVKKVTTTGFQIYNSLTNNNLNHQLLDTSNWKLVMDSDNLYAFDSAVVHIAGAETITGVKTFTSKIYTAPIELFPVSGNDKDYIDFHFGGDTSDYTARIIENTSGNLTIEATSFLVPTPSDTTSTSSIQAATVGWANTTGNNLVHLSDNETIAGAKTFMSSNLKIKSNSTTTGTAPSSTQVNSVQFVDSNNRVMGWVYSSYNAQKEAAVRLQAMKSNAAGDTEYSSIGVAYPATGNPYGFAPSSDENGSILTTVAKNKATNGYFKLGNGMIVQWGRTTNTVNQTKTITFPVAFTSTNYSITVAANNQSSGYSYDGVTGISDRTTTSCKVYSYYADRTYDWIAIGY